MKNSEEQFDQSKLKEGLINPEPKQEISFIVNASENMPSDFDTNLEKQEIQENQLIEYSEKVGSFYSSFIENLTKTGEAKNEILDELPDDIKNKFKDYLDCIEKNSQLQHVRFSLKKDGGKDLLLKSIERKDLDKETKELINDQTKYELEEVSPGYFVIHMDEDLYSRLYGKAVACASINSEDISFIALPKKYKEYTEEKYIKNIYEENLKHETHHIVWSFLLKDKKINIKEADDNMWRAYRIFQDEVIARLVSGGGHMGYTHLYLAERDGKKPAGLTPENEQLIKQKTLALNIIMDEIIPDLSEAEFKRQDLIFSIMKAENFEELENNLEKIQTVIEMKAKENRKSKPKIITDGWGSIAT